MKKLKISFIYVLLVILSLGLVQAQGLISAQELPNYLKQDNTILICAQKAADYNRIHITGAINIDHNMLYDDMTMLLPDAEVARILGKNGVSRDMKIVVYDEGSFKYAGRMYWILDYMGAKDVKILNGGLDAWKAARKPVTRTATVAKAVTFTPVVNKSYLASMETVKSVVNNPAFVIIDARSSEEFKGQDNSNLRLGHIPSAVNINYADLIDARGLLKSNEELADIFIKAGVTKDKTAIVYCKTSVRAGIVYFALKSSLNYPKVKLYDGAYLEWQDNNTNRVSM